MRHTLLVAVCGAVLLGGYGLAVTPALGQQASASARATSTRQMLAAAQRGDWARVEAHVRQGADINARNSQGRTPLILAIDTGKSDAVGLLLRLGADPNTNIEGVTALLMAAFMNWGTETETVRKLVGAGARVNVQQPPCPECSSMDGPGRQAPLHGAAFRCNVEIARILVDAGARLEVRDGNGDTPLAESAKHGCPSVLEFLISRGANVNTRSDNGLTPLHHAAISGGSFETRDGRKVDASVDEGRLVSILLRAGAQRNARTGSGQTALDLAQEFNHRQSAAILRGGPDPFANGSTAARPAATAGVQDDIDCRTGYALPINPTGRVWSFFDAAYRASENRNHLGVDLPARAGLPVWSPVDGEVVLDRTRGAAASSAYMVIRDGRGAEHVLGHVASSKRVGDRVRQGDTVATVMNWPGNSHVHWGVASRGLTAAVGSSAEGEWGWGRAPSTTTLEQAAARGWLDVTAYATALRESAASGQVVNSVPGYQRPVPTASRPANRARSASGQAIELAWTRSDGARDYGLQIDCFAGGAWCSDAGAQTLIFERMLRTSCRYTPASSGRWRWRVWARYADGAETSRSPWREFEVR